MEFVSEDDIFTAANGPTYTPAGSPAFIPPASPSQPAGLGDPDLNDQWGLTKISAPTAWLTRKEASAIVIAILDSCISHPEFSGRFVTGANFSGGSSEDTYGHGTHVAGIAAAAGNNGIGISGVSQNSKIMAVKLFNGGEELLESKILSGINYAVMHGAKVINGSFSGPHNTPLDPDNPNPPDYIKVAIRDSGDNQDWPAGSGHPAYKDNVV